MAGEGRRGIKAVEVAGRILDHLARAQTSVALRDLATTGRMSPGKVHRYLASFLASGLARQDPEHASMRLARSLCGLDLPR
jgi:DNA-binding IclR family transcriptional regulator